MLNLTRTLVSCSLIAALMLPATDARAESGFSATEVALLEATASKTPYVGEFLAPVVGIMFAPENEIDALREELKGYVDLALLRQSHKLIQLEVGRWKRILVEAENDIRSKRFSDAQAKLVIVDTEIIGANDTYLVHLKEADDDSYLMIYTGLALFHMEVLNARAKLEYSEWPSKQKCEWNWTKYSEDEPCSMFLRINGTQTNYYREIEAEVARSLRRRVNAVTDWGSDHLGLIPSEFGGSVDLGMGPPYFVDRRIGLRIELLSRELPKGETLAERRLRYTYKVERELEAHWESTALTPLTEAYLRIAPW